MKLKISPQFLIAQSNKIFAASLLLAASFSFSVHSQEINLSNKNISAKVLPGLYSSFEEFIKINQDKFQNKIKQQGNRYSDLTDLTNPENLELDADFLGSVIFQTPSRYLSLGTKDKCSFYDLFLADLLKSPEKDFSTFLVKYQDNKGEIVTRLVKRDVFIKKVIQTTCPQSIRFSQYFNDANVQKTLKTVNFKTPTSVDECLNIHETLIKDYKTPYLCQIQNKIESIEPLSREIRNTPTSNYQKLGNLRSELRGAQSYLRMLNSDALNYLENLCLNLEKPRLFCENFFTTSFWAKVLGNQKSIYNLKSRCVDLLKKRNLNENDYKRCITKLERSPDTCHYAGMDDALYPAPNCVRTTDLLNYSRLNKNYEECPGNSFNTAITNAGRVLQHLSPLKEEAQTNCSVISAESYARMTFPVIETRGYATSACFQDNINNKEVCYPTYFGNYGTSDYSLSSVVSQILYRTKGTDRNSQCKLSKASEYNSVLLSYKSGCHIILPDAGCFNTNCNVNIILDDKKITHIKFNQYAFFDYMPRTVMTEKYSFTKLIETELKKNSKAVRNISNLKFFFKQNPKTILHGIGCKEMLLPSFYNMRAFNQCTPLPFIVDGYKEKNGEVSLIMRTALDSLYAPRLISWSYVYQAVLSFQSHHPLNQWGLYAVY